MWVKQTVPAANRSIGVWAVASDLTPGQVFSINEKSNRFAFIRIAEDGQIMAQPVIETGQPAMEAPAPVAVPVDMEVMVHPPETQPINPLAKEYSLYDRVRLHDANVTGTVIDVNISKFPDVDVIVLWDSVLHGNIMSEVHPHEIEHMNQKAQDNAYHLAREAREFLKNVQDQHKDSFKDKVVKEVLDATARQKKTDDFKQVLAQAQAAKIKQIANDTINKFAGDFKAMTTAGVMAVTAGSYDYEIDEVPTIVGNYSDIILSKVNTVTNDQTITAAAAVEIMRHMAKTMMDGYNLLRQAYIRKHGGKYVVSSKDGKTLGEHITKSAAIKQLRTIEYNKHHRS